MSNNTIYETNFNFPIKNVVILFQNGWVAHLNSNFIKNQLELHQKLKADKIKAKAVILNEEADLVEKSISDLEINSENDLSSENRIKEIEYYHWRKT